MGRRLLEESNTVARLAVQGDEAGGKEGKDEGDIRENIGDVRRGQNCESSSW